MNNSYQIFSNDVLVATWNGRELHILDAARAPQYLIRTGNFEGWLASRSIDRYRTNARLLKKALHLADKDDAHISLAVNGATVTDNYWVRPVGSSLQYENVRFTDDCFAALALNGDYDSFNSAAQSKNIKTPQLTATGTFEKSWKLEKGVWWLYKQATKEELFSELFVCLLGEKLGLRMAYYEQSGEYIKTKGFTENGCYNFEPAAAFVDKAKDYFAVIEALSEICPNAIPDYVRMVFLDAVCCNVDRHKFNFGLLRNAETGDYIGLAPIFDHNIALIARSHLFISEKGETLIFKLCELLFAHPEYTAYLPSIAYETIEETAEEIALPVNKSLVVNQVFSRYRRIMESLQAGEVKNAPLPSEAEMEAAFPPFLRDSINAMSECKTQLARGERCFRLDCIADDLQSSINIAEVDGLITTDIASFLRTKYLL